MISTSTKKAGNNFPPPTVTVALWRFRQTWGMLVITGIGIIAAVMLVCSVPLYSRVATTAGLRSVLNAVPDGSTLTIHADMNGISSQGVHDVRNDIERLPSNAISHYLSGPPQFTIQTQGLQILSPQPENRADTLTLNGYSIQQVATHIKLLKGRMPAQPSKATEIAITFNTAMSLHLSIGSSIIIQIPFTTNIPGQLGATSQIQKLTLHVVGIFSENAPSDLFWHGNTFEPTIVQPLPPRVVSFGAIISNETLLSALDRFIAKGSDAIFLSPISNLYWYYQLDASKITIDQLDELINSLNSLQNTISFTSQKADAVSYPYMTDIDITGSVLNTYNNPGTLEQYRNRIDVARIPVSILLFQIVGLILFFISLMTELLIERQADAIALLKSRGASKRQIFGSFLTQGLGLSFIALLLGPLIAVLAVFLFAHKTLSPLDQDTINIIFDDLPGTLLRLRWYALLAAFVAVIAMAIAVYRATTFDLLLLRRESTRSTRRPLWQRLYLDVFASIIALTSYAISIYLTNIQEIQQNAQISVLILTPLALIAPLFLILASILLFIRIFPLFLKRGTWLAIRGRGATMLLALAQMARKPYQSIRMTLLLTLTIAFTIFALVFTATQSQHSLEVANYQVGADFSGHIPNVDTSRTLTQQETTLSKIQGVASATIGYAGQSVAVSSTSTGNIAIRAIDPETFAQTVIWNAHDASLPLIHLMHLLDTQRTTAVAADTIPVVIDTLLEQQLGVQVGSRFTIDWNGNFGIQCLVIGEVQHIPTVDDSTTIDRNNSVSISGGILADFTSYVSVYKADFHGSLTLNYAWLRTKDDGSILANLRHTLTTQQPRIDPLYDRRALLADLQNSPLALDLVGVLIIGATTALFLALVASLIAAWINARSRLTSFAILRALGTVPTQVANILVWEQAIVYGTALILGSAFGWLLSVTLVPSLVFTDTPVGSNISNTGNGDFYAFQKALPSQIVFPFSLVVAGVILIVIYALTLMLMIRIHSRPKLGQTLRLNED